MWQGCLLLITLLSLSCFADIDKSVKELEKKSGCSLIITSGYRSKQKNKQVGGAPNSYHLHNRARDLVPKDKKCITFKQLAKIACKMKLNVIEYSSHIHIDNRKNPKCWRNNGN